MNNDNYKKMMDFFFEIGQLKRIPRSGWVALGIKNPESVADHTSRSVFISFVIAKLEGADPYKAAIINAFHELPETRIGDLHKVAQRYINGREVEKEVMKEQFESLPKEIGDDFRDILTGFGEDTSKEQVVAKDADYVEVAIQAKEYIEQGFKDAQNWIDNSRKCVRTETAKKFYEVLEKSSSQDWFKELKNIKR